MWASRIAALKRALISLFLTTSERMFFSLDVP